MDLFGDPGSLEHLAAELRAAAGALDGSQGVVVAGVSGVVPGSWEGPAASAFEAHSRSTAGTIAALGGTASEMGGTLDRLAGELRRAQGMARQAQDIAAAHGLVIGSDGRVADTTIFQLPLDHAQEQARSGAQGLINAALLVADVARGQAASALSLVLVPPAEPPGTTPAAARSWAGIPVPQHGSSFLGVALGVGTIVAGGLIDLAAGALDDTGVGAVVGVPAGEEGTGLVADGLGSIGGEEAGPAGADPANLPPIQQGEIKGIGSYRTGLTQLSERPPVNVDALAVYDSAGNVHLQVWETVDGVKRLISDTSLGRVAQVPSAPPGTTVFGNQMEPLVRALVEERTGQQFAVKAANAGGPDLVPR